MLAIHIYEFRTRHHNNSKILMFLKLYGFVGGLEGSVIKLPSSVFWLVSEYCSFLLRYYFIEFVRVTVYSFTLTVLQV